MPSNYLVCIGLLLLCGCSRYGFDDGAGASDASAEDSVADLRVVDDSASPSDTLREDIALDSVSMGDGTASDSAANDSGLADSSLADGTAADTTSRADGTVSRPPLTHVNDTCDTPRAIDLSSLAPGLEIHVPVDPTGAHDDYPFGVCSGLPDLAFSLTNPPVMVVMGCLGPGRLGIAAPTTRDCRGGGGTYWLICGLDTIMLTQPTSTMIACHERTTRPLVLVFQYLSPE